MIPDPLPPILRPGSLTDEHGSVPRRVEQASSKAPSRLLLLVENSLSHSASCLFPLVGVWISWLRYRHNSGSACQRPNGIDGHPLGNSARLRIHSARGSTAGCGLANLTDGDVLETASFYHFFHTTPSGRYRIYLSNTAIAKMHGYQQVSDALERETGAKFDGPASPDFGLFETACIGLSDQEPAMLIDDVVFTDLTPT